MSSQVVLVLLCLIGSQKIDNPTAISLSAKGSQTTWKVSLKKKKFEAKGRVVVEGEESSARSLPALVEGRPALGTGGGYPRYEFAEFRVWANGKLIKIPRRHYSDCFEPNLRKTHCFLFPHQGGKFARLKLICSDAGGRYTMIWTIHISGRVTRKYMVESW